MTGFDAVAARMVPPAEPRAPVSVLAIHGTSALNAPYGGGIGPRSLSGVDYPPVRQVVERWAAVCGTAPAPRVDRRGMVTRETWTGGRRGTEGPLVTIEGGGHSRPRGRPPAGVRGPPTP